MGARERSEKREYPELAELEIFYCKLILSYHLKINKEKYIYKFS